MHFIKLRYKLFIFYNDYETSYTTYTNHSSWFQCSRPCALRVEGIRAPKGNQRVRLGDHMVIMLYALDTICQYISTALSKSVLYIYNNTSLTTVWSSDA
mgnify:CR=1 FL=1